MLTVGWLGRDAGVSSLTSLNMADLLAPDSYSERDSDHFSEDLFDRLSESGVSIHARSGVTVYRTLQTLSGLPLEVHKLPGVYFHLLTKKKRTTVEKRD